MVVLVLIFQAVQAETIQDKLPINFKLLNKYTHCFLQGRESYQAEIVTDDVFFRELNQSKDATSLEAL